MTALPGQQYVNANILNSGFSQPAPSNTVIGISAKIEDTNAANVIAANAGAGLRYYITDVLVTNGDATVGTLVTIKDGAGVTLAQGYASPAGGGFSHSYTTHIPCTPNSNVQAICGTTSAEVYVSVVGYRAA